MGSGKLIDSTQEPPPGKEDEKKRFYGVNPAKKEVDYQSQAEETKPD